MMRCAAWVPNPVSVRIGARPPADWQRVGTRYLSEWATDARPLPSEIDPVSVRIAHRRAPLSWLTCGSQHPVSVRIGGRSGQFEGLVGNPAFVRIAWMVTSQADPASVRMHLGTHKISSR